MTTFGYRELTGCLPPKDNPTRYRIFWREVSDKKLIFFAQLFVKDFDIWVPCDSRVFVITGGSRVPVNQFDRGSDSIHVILRWDEDDDLFIQLEIKDLRAFLTFTPEQLSNPEGSGEKTLFDVEEGRNRERLD